MDTFVNRVNWSWNSTDGVQLAAYVLWKLNQIHPFINGNGRTSRATCYFVLCLKSGGWLPGRNTLPYLLGSEPNRSEHISILERMDDPTTHRNAFQEMVQYLNRLLEQQLASA